MTVTEIPRSTSSTGVSVVARERVVVRLSPDDKERVRYWADRRGFSSMNEYISEAVAEQIRRENHDYDLPTLEIRRLNELVDEIEGLSRVVANLQRTVTSLSDSLIGLTRGDSEWLKDHEDGATW